MTESTTSNNTTQEYPVLMMRGLVVLPGNIIHFDVGRSQTIAAVKQAIKEKHMVFLVTQSNPTVEKPVKKDLYTYGVIAEIRQVLDRQEGALRILVEAKERAKLLQLNEVSDYLSAEVSAQPYEEVDTKDHEFIALLRTAKNLFNEYCKSLPQAPSDIAKQAMLETDPLQAFQIMTNVVMMDFESRQMLLEQKNLFEQMYALNVILADEIDVLQLQKEVSFHVHENMENRNREFYIREQIKVLQEQLGGDQQESEEEVNEFLDQVNKIKNISEETRGKLLKECERLAKVEGFPQEATVIRNYLEICLSLPWDSTTKDKIDVEKAARSLDRDHYGLTDVKQRILEFLAVRKLAPDIKGQIICLVGPPGIGKTSIGASIAKAMGRKYVRVSLGGVRDEAEIRGHRKTYIGAMPGRIINAMIDAKSNNPLILLDEIDKMANDVRGDPASAMLEVLDSAQNATFRDHFLEIPFDLSHVLFITTANSVSTIPPPLLDRMEVIELTSYTREEKFNIAKKHLLPKQMKQHGLTVQSCNFNKAAIYELIDSYTREAGVRILERTIASICRKAAKSIVAGETEKVAITLDQIETMLGPKKYLPSEYAQEDEIGVVNGLAWTSVGGEMLEIEVAVMKGTGKVKLTGSLGDVMKESADIAVSYVRSIADEYQIDPDFYKKMDLHIHAPEGAVPKDGPSAGVTMVTALVSALSKRPVNHKIAMTGEISLRGKVLPIGGLREKSMAAYKADKTTVIIPKGNYADLTKIDDVVKEKINFVPVSNVRQVLDAALL